MAGVAPFDNSLFPIGRKHITALALVVGVVATGAGDRHLCRLDVAVYRLVECFHFERMAHTADHPRVGLLRNFMRTVALGAIRDCRESLLLQVVGKSRHEFL